MLQKIKQWLCSNDDKEDPSVKFLSEIRNLYESREHCLNACTQISEANALLQEHIESLEKQIAEIRAVMTEACEYLDSNELNTIGHGSILHRKLHDMSISK